TDQAAAARMLTETAGAFPQRVLQRPQRIVRFHRLNRSISSIGHMRMDGRFSSALRRGSGSSGKGLIVGVGTLSDRIKASNDQVVHGWLGRGRNKVRGCL